MGLAMTLGGGDNMTLRDIIVAVDASYGDGLLLSEHDHHEERGEHASGDGLAAFIVTELRETYEPRQSREAQLAEAKRVLGVAAWQLQRAAEAIEALG